MSGGSFDYDQYKIVGIVEQIEDFIFHNGSEEKNEWGERRYQEFPPDIIDKFKKAVNILNEAYVYAQRIDWLVSGDDGEDSFMARLKGDLEKLVKYDLEKENNEN